MTGFVFDQDVLRDYNQGDAITPLSDIKTRSGLDLFPKTNSWPNGDLNGALGC